MRYLFFFLLIGLLQGVSAQRPDVSSMERYAEKARREWECPGMSVGLILNDTVILAKGFGTLSTEDSTPVNEQTIFGIASNSKSFTSAAIAMLIDENKLSWDTRIVSVLSYFRMYNEYVTNEITIRDALSHRSGLKTFSGDLIWYGSEHNRREIIEHARFLKPAHGFRAAYGYSNILYLVAGEIVAEVSGTSYEKFISERIFKPLGMSSSNLSITANKKNPNVAQPHALVEKKWIPIPYVNWDNITPAGGINSNVVDMLKWIQLQLHRGTLDGKKYWTEKQSREMWFPQTIKQISSFGERIMPSRHFAAYGLGWEVFDFKGYKIVHHSGGLDGMVSHTFMIPEINAGGVVLTNNATTLPYAMMMQLCEFLIGDPKQNDWSLSYLEIQKSSEKYVADLEKNNPKKPKNTPMSFALKDYVGLYSGNVYGNVRVDIKEEKLFLKMMHTPTMFGYLNHEYADVFSIQFGLHPSLPKGEVVFVVDEEKNKIKQLIIDIPNPDFDFTELDLNKVK